MVLLSTGLLVYSGHIVIDWSQINNMFDQAIILCKYSTLCFCFYRRISFERSEIQKAVIVPIQVFPDNGVIEQIAELISEQEALDTLQLLYLTVFVIQVLSNDHIWALEYIVFCSFPCQLFLFLTPSFR